MQLLSEDPLTAKELSQLAGLSEREVYDHLTHLQKSLKSKRQRLVVTPALCLDCQFNFRKRERLTRPGRCPVCRSTRIALPSFSIS